MLKPLFLSLCLSGTLVWKLPAIAQEQRSMLSVAEGRFAREDYAMAIPLYADMIKRQHGSAFLYRRIANCYEGADNYVDAALWYGKLTSDTAGVTEDDWFHYGDILKSLGKYPEARAAFSHCHGERAATRIAGCDSVPIWAARPPRFAVRNVAELNTSLSDWGAVGYRNRYIVFTSDSSRYTALEPTDQVNVDDFGRTRTAFQKLYRLDTSSGNREFGFIYGLGQGLNQYKYHIGPVTFSKAYDTLFMTVSNPARISYTKQPVLPYARDPWRRRMGYRRLILLIGVRKGDTWGPLVPFPYNQPDSFSVGHAALSPGSDVLYFASDMPGGSGGIDIWYSEKLNDSTWGPPHNCGPVINTEDDEAFPSMGQDGALYFASKGHAGLGGFDIFRSTGSRDHWTTPENLGIPVNSSQDDFYLTQGDSLRGYFASNRFGGKGSDDIYAYTAIPLPGPTAVKPAPPPAPAPPAPEKQPEPFHAGEVLTLHNLFYDLDKSNIRPDAARVLDSVAGILKAHPTMRIELSSHTDSRGNDAYNMALSEHRAKSAVNYLISKGIAPERLIARGYGETRPVNRCTNGVPCSEAEHQANRRTEIRVLQP